MVNKLLKWLLILVLLVIVITIIISCINVSNKVDIIENEIEQFSGVVDETTATSIVVIPDENENIRKSSDKISISANGVGYKKGDRVTVTYKGAVAEIYPARIDVITVIKEDYSSNVKLYVTLIDNIMKEDESLNENIEYLSVDIDSFKSAIDNYTDITEEDKSKILGYCSKYSSDIRAYSLAELKEQDLFNNQTMSLNGMVIYIDRIYELTSTKVKLKIVKYVGGDGAYYATYTLKYIDNMWKITEAEYAIS